MQNRLGAVSTPLIIFAAITTATTAFAQGTVPESRPSEGIEVEAPLANARPAGDWAAFGNDPGGSQYSPLDQINTKTVARLKIAWVHKSGDSMPANESGIIHANDTLYYCTPANRVIALDPATGAEKWTFDPRFARVGGKPVIDGPPTLLHCRGVTYWQAANPRPGAQCEKRIFKGDINNNIYAMDADTGKPCEDFGAGKGHPGYVAHQDFKGYGDGQWLGITSPAVTLGDILISGTSSLDWASANANNGIVRGFDVRTRELKWEFNPIPEEKRTATGAANVWSTMSVDTKRNLVFLPTTSPSSDYYGATRNFENPLDSAVVALDATTGKLAWSFQTVHHNLFDYDLPGHPLLVTIKKDGQDIDVAIQQSKMGWVFVLDRDTGKPVWPIDERPVPKGDVPQETYSPTQPVPQLPEPFSRQTLTREDMFGLTPIDAALCRREFDKMYYKGMYKPRDPSGVLVVPIGSGRRQLGWCGFRPADQFADYQSRKSSDPDQADPRR